MFLTATRADPVDAAHLLAIPPTAHSPTTQGACSLCGGLLRRELIDLGRLPPSHQTLARDAAEAAPAHPLRVLLCETCKLVQLAESSVRQGNAVPTPTRDDLAAVLSHKWKLGPASRVVAVGRGGDGWLRRLRDAGVGVLAIAPADDGVPLAAASGIPTEAGPLTTETAMQVAVRLGRADLVVVGEALTKAADLFDFAAGLASLVRPNGVVLITVPHLMPLLQHSRVDAFRHDVRHYLSLHVLERLLCSVGLRVFDVERLPEEGGLLRVHACPTAARHTARPGLKIVRMAESLVEAGHPDLYDGFAERTAAMLEQVRGFLAARHAARRRVAAYGATVRGAALLNLCGQTAAEIGFVAANDPALHGRLMPGSRIPIGSLRALAEAPPQDLLILPGSTQHEIINLLAPIRQLGTQFWTLLPRIARV